jgi:hypothetical protein
VPPILIHTNYLLPHPLTLLRRYANPFHFVSQTDSAPLPPSGAGSDPKASGKASTAALDVVSVFQLKHGVEAVYRYKAAVRLLSPFLSCY